MKLTPTAFADQGEIPRRHTCEGEDLAPPLSWSEALPQAPAAWR